MLRIVSAGALALALSSGAHGQDDSGPALCFTPDMLSQATKDVAAKMPDKGILIASDGAVNGKNIDRVIVIQGGATIMAFTFEKGCMTGKQDLDEAAGPGKVDDGKPKVGA